MTCAQVSDEEACCRELDAAHCEWQLIQAASLQGEYLYNAFEADGIMNAVLQDLEVSVHYTDRSETRARPQLVEESKYTLNDTPGPNRHNEAS